MALEESTRIPTHLVVAAYRTLLNREPESEEAIRNHAEKHSSAEDLLGAFLNCEEFREKASRRYGDHMARVASVYRQRMNHIDVIASPDDFSRIFARIRDQWTALGKTEPYWSVVTQDRFRMSSIQKTKNDFYASGADSDRLIDIFCQRTNVVRPSGVCLELGCGVGRVTGFLAKRFDHVIAFDVSQGNLDLAREHLSETGIRNVDLVLLRDLADIELTKNFNFFYSVIVLQHNPPPVIAKLLRIIMAKLNSGGGFLFQLPTHLKGYEFIVERYLLSHDPVGNGFEIHALTMHNVLEIIQDAGGCLKEVLADNWTGTYGSHTFFGVKPQDAHAHLNEMLSAS